MDRNLPPRMPLDSLEWVLDLGSIREEAEAAEAPALFSGLLYWLPIQGLGQLAQHKILPSDRCTSRGSGLHTHRHWIIVAHPCVDTFFRIFSDLIPSTVAHHWQGRASKQSVLARAPIRCLRKTRSKASALQSLRGVLDLEWFLHWSNQ